MIAWEVLEADTIYLLLLVTAMQNTEEVWPRSIAS